MTGGFHRLAILIVIAGLAASARADDRIDQARHQVAAADIDYKLGKFTEALDKYSKAYELYPAAPLLFNIGQCHRNLKNHERAVFFFEGYLRDNPTASNRLLVEDLIRESKAELAKQAELERQQADSKPKADQQMVTHEPPPRRDESTPSRMLPLGLVAGGATTFASGAVFYYFGQKRGPNEMFVYDDTRILGGTLMVLGAAAAVTGAYLLIHHSSAAPIAVVSSQGLFIGLVGEL